MKRFLKLLCLLPIAVSCDHASAETIRITPLVSGVTASFRGLALRNSREAWIAGSDGTVIRTTDSGRSWQGVIVPGSDALDFRDVEVLPDGTVVLMSIGKGELSRLFRSADGGKTWETVLINTEPNGFFDGMAFDRADRRGVLFGDPIEGKLDVYVTADGGASWKRLPTRPEVKEGEYGFAASGTGIVMSGQNIWIATGGSVARVWHSADDGAIWRAHDTPLRSGNASSGIFSIAFIDEQRAVVIGGDYAAPALDSGNVATSANGGQSWTTDPTVKMPHKACVQSLGDGRLLACGRTGVIFSEDAGRTWETISTDGYYTLAADLTSGTGFLAGKEGRIARFEFAIEGK